MGSKLLLLGLFLSLSVCDAFLLDSRNVTTVTVKEFMELFKQVNDQQTKYDLLEKEFKALNMSYNTLETKYQNLSRADSDLEQKYQNVSESYDEIVTKLQNVTNAMGMSKINLTNTCTCSDIDERLQNFTNAFHETDVFNQNRSKADKDIIMKLSTAYMDASAKYQNLSLAHGEMENGFQNLSKENEVLTASIGRQTKELSDVKESIANMSKFYNALELNYHSLSDAIYDVYGELKNLTHAYTHAEKKYQNMTRVNLGIEVKYQNLSKAYNYVETMFKNLAVNFFGLDSQLRALKHENADLLAKYHNVSHAQRSTEMLYNTLSNSFLVLAGNHSNQSIEFHELYCSFRNTSTSFSFIETQQTNLTLENYIDLVMQKVEEKVISLLPEYNKTQANYQNNSHAYSDIKTDFENVWTTINLTAAMNKILSKVVQHIELELHNLSQLNTDLQTSYANLTRAYDYLKAQEDVLELKFTNFSEDQLQALAETTDKIAWINQTVENNTYTLLELTEKQGYESAFSAYYPLPFSQNATTLKFHMIYTNIGGDYNETSGNFTCRYPGIYIFTLHLHHNASDKAVCDIVRNGQNTVTAYSMPLMQRQVIHLYEAGNSIVLHLNSGDVVTVRCEKDSGLLGYSSFTGILIKAD